MVVFVIKAPGFVGSMAHSMMFTCVLGCSRGRTGRRHAGRPQVHDLGSRHGDSGSSGLLQLRAVDHLRDELCREDEMREWTKGEALLTILPAGECRAYGRRNSVVNRLNEPGVVFCRLCLA